MQAIDGSLLTFQAETRICANPACGAEFQPSREWQRFCSKACRVDYHANRLTDPPTHRVAAKAGDIILITVEPGG